MSLAPKSSPRTKKALIRGGWLVPLGHLQEGFQMFHTRKRGLGASFPGPEEMDRLLQGGLHFLNC